MANHWRTVYVIELDDESPLKRRNDPSMPYLYVGITYNTPEERFSKHMEGGRTASKIVTNHGIELRPDLYSHYKKVRGDDNAAMLEQEVAKELKEKGYIVHSGKPGFFWDQYK
jgi:hypothetical protein